QDGVPEALQELPRPPPEPLLPLRREHEPLADVFAKRVALHLEVEDVLYAVFEVPPRLGEPDRVEVRLEELGVGEVEAGRRDRAGDHLVPALGEGEGVGAPPAAEGEHERGLAAAAPPAAAPRGVRRRWGGVWQGGAAASRAAAALRVVRRRWRDVAQVDHAELADVDAELHGRRAEEHR